MTHMCTLKFSRSHTKNNAIQCWLLVRVQPPLLYPSRAWVIPGTQWVLEILIAE